MSEPLVPTIAVEPPVDLAVEPVVFEAVAVDQVHNANSRVELFLQDGEKGLGELGKGLGKNR